MSPASFQLPVTSCEAGPLLKALLPACQKAIRADSGLELQVLTTPQLEARLPVAQLEQALAQYFPEVLVSVVPSAYFPALPEAPVGLVQGEARPCAALRELRRFRASLQEAGPVPAGEDADEATELDSDYELSLQAEPTQERVFWRVTKVGGAVVESKERDAWPLPRSGRLRFVLSQGKAPGPGEVSLDGVQGVLSEDETTEVVYVNRKRRVKLAYSPDQWQLDRQPDGHWTLTLVGTMPMQFRDGKTKSRQWLVQGVPVPLTEGSTWLIQTQLGLSLEFGLGRAQ